jgi:hypothetical protein
MRSRPWRRARNVIGLCSRRCIRCLFIRMQTDS